MAQLLQAGQRIGGYEVEALIGRGGMGEVYRARQLSMDRHVALKVLSPRLARQDPQFAKQFVDEARAAGRLNHANIIHVHDVGKAVLEAGGEDVHYFSMELVDGESVKDILRREGVVPDEVMTVVMLGMAEALCYAESVGIIHRDIKPDNIMLSPGREVKLADLGLAMQAGEEAEIGKDGGKAKVMGTPLYMSPEQARAASLDHRSDQYSLGATLFHMLTGEPPYAGNDARSIMRSHVFDEVPNPAEIRAEAPKAWCKLCMRLMAKDPDQRFRTAADLRTAVRSAAGHSPGPRRTAPRGGSVGGRAWLVPAAAAAAVAVAGLLTWALWPTGRQVRPDPNQAIAALPADDTAARLRLQQLIQDDRTWDDAARARFNAELQRRVPTVVRTLQTAPATAATTSASDAAKLKALNDALAIISADLAAGDLAKAQGGLDALNLAPIDQVRWQAAAPVRMSVVGAVMEAGSVWQKRIVAANAAGVDALAADLAAARLPPALRSDLERRLATRRETVARQQATATEQATLLAWRTLYAELDSKRCTDRFGELKAAIETAAPALPEADRIHAIALAGLGKAIQNAEGALRVAVRSRPVVDAVIAGQPIKARLLQLSSTTITWQPADGGAEAQTPRATFGCAWDAPLTKALAECEVEDPVAAKAAFLWFWRDAATADAIAALGDAPLGAAMARLESAGRVLPTRASALWKDGKVQVTYDFAGAGAATVLADFTTGATAVPAGLSWETRAQRGDREDQVPTLRWNQALRPPMTAAMTLTVDDGSLIAVGVSAGGRAVRAVFSTRGKTTAKVGLVASNAAGGLDLIPVQDQPEITAGMPVACAVAANGTVTVAIAGTDVSSALGGRALPAGAPVTVVIQSMQRSGRSAVVVGSLTITGQP